MDEIIEIWDVLHDGEISAIAGENSSSVTLFVHIPYLRRRFEPLGNSFILALDGVKEFKYLNSDGKREEIQDALDSEGITILSTNSESMPVTIYTGLGELVVDCAKITYSLDSGQEIEYAAIKNACIEYWDEWEAKSKKAQESAKRKNET